MGISFASIVLRLSIMYVLALVLIRISGKQSISELSTMDFVMITILGDGFDSVIFSEVSLMEGAVASISLVLMHILVRYLSSRSKLIFRLAQSPPTLMIENGIVLGEGLRIERERPETLAAEMRLMGVDQLTEVKEAWLEENGRLSVLKNIPSKPIQKQDLKLSK